MYKIKATNKLAIISVTVTIALVIVSAINTPSIIKLLSALAQSESSAATNIKSSPSSSSGQVFSAKLTGSDEVPPVNTDATGTIKLTANPHQSTIGYELTTTNLNGVVTGAHIHMGKSGGNGPIVTDLNIPNTSMASAAASAGGGTATTSNSVGGTIISTDLKGQLKGKQISDLIKLIDEGRAYANVHTEQNPKGEIRGQLSASASGTTRSTDNSASASASASSIAP